MMKSFALAFFVNLAVGAVIDRHSIVTRYNPQRNASSQLTPMQIGNGNFAFGADITGLQTFQPFAIMSSWGWKNDTLPLERLWRTSRITTELVLDLWTGILRSSFSFGGATVTVETACAQDSDSVAIRLESSLVQTGKLGVFLDFPWNDGKAKFSAPFVGNWEAAANHTTSLDVRDDTEAQVTHILDSATFVTTIQGDTFSITRDSPTTHRYSVHPRQNVSSFSFVLSFGSPETANVPKSSFLEVTGESTQKWMDYWAEGGFVDVATGSSHPDAQELQRRIILSRYLMRVNEAGDAPPQESGLVNDGWYGYVLHSFMPLVILPTYWLQENSTWVPALAFSYHEFINRVAQKCTFGTVPTGLSGTTGTSFGIQAAFTPASSKARLRGHKPSRGGGQGLDGPR
ncbi:hypothetical protein BD779DRAFT_1802445 [Infundibulicybe gibba]|nr:hypothetical protein BD779DRAFT_1802445 [Infundibulicybe gibba]